MYCNPVFIVATLLGSRTELIATAAVREGTNMIVRSSVIHSPVQLQAKFLEFELRGVDTFGSVSDSVVTLCQENRAVVDAAVAEVLAQGVKIPARRYKRINDSHSACKIHARHLSVNNRVDLSALVRSGICQPLVLDDLITAGWFKVGGTFGCVGNGVKGEHVLQLNADIPTRMTDIKLPTSHFVATRADGSEVYFAVEIGHIAVMVSTKRPGILHLVTRRGENRARMTKEGSRMLNTLVRGSLRQVNQAVLYRKYLGMNEPTSATQVAAALGLDVSDAEGVEAISKLYASLSAINGFAYLEAKSIKTTVSSRSILVMRRRINTALRTLMHTGRNPTAETTSRISIVMLTTLAVLYSVFAVYRHSSDVDTAIAQFQDACRAAGLLKDSPSATGRGRQEKSSAGKDLAVTISSDGELHSYLVRDILNGHTADLKAAHLTDGNQGQCGEVALRVRKVGSKNEGVVPVVEPVDEEPRASTVNTVEKSSSSVQPRRLTEAAHVCETVNNPTRAMSSSGGQQRGAQEVSMPIGITQLSRSKPQEARPSETRVSLQPPTTSRRDHNVKSGARLSSTEENKVRGGGDLREQHVLEADQVKEELRLKTRRARDMARRQIADKAGDSLMTWDHEQVGLGKLVEPTGEHPTRGKDLRSMEEVRDFDQLKGPIKSVRLTDYDSVALKACLGAGVTNRALENILAARSDDIQFIAAAQEANSARATFSAWLFNKVESICKKTEPAHIIEYLAWSTFSRWFSRLALTEPEGVFLVTQNGSIRYIPASVNTKEGIGMLYEHLANCHHIVTDTEFKALIELIRKLSTGTKGDLIMSPAAHKFESTISRYMRYPYPNKNAINIVRLLTMRKLRMSVTTTKGEVLHDTESARSLLREGLPLDSLCKKPAPHAKHLLLPRRMFKQQVAPLITNIVPGLSPAGHTTLMTKRAYLVKNKKHDRREMMNAPRPPIDAYDNPTGMIIDGLSGQHEEYSADLFFNDDYASECDY